MEVFEEKGTEYSPAYVRNNLTDDLHDIFGFKTDHEILAYEIYEKNFKLVKSDTSTQKIKTGNSSVYLGLQAIFMLQLSKRRF